MTRSAKVELEHVNEQVFENQIEALVEDDNFDIETEAEAERMFTDVQTEIMLKSQDAGRNWSHSQISALTHYTIGLNRVGMDAQPSGKTLILARWGPRIAAMCMWVISGVLYFNSESLLVVGLIFTIGVYVWLTGV